MSSRVGSWLVRSTTSKRAAAFTTPSIAPTTVQRITSPCTSTSRTPGRPVNASAGTGEAKWISSARAARVFSEPMSSTVISRPSRMIPTRSQTRSTSGRSCDERKTRLARRARLQHELVEPLLHDGIQPLRRLVEDQQRRPVHERLDHAELLLVPVRQRGDLRGQIALQPIGQRVDELPVDAPAERREEVQVLPSRQVLVRNELAREVAHPAVDLDARRRRFQAEDGGATRRRSDEVQERADRRRLAGAVGAEEPEHLAGLDRQGDVDDAARGPVRLREVFRHDDAVGGHGPRLYPIRRGRCATKSTMGLGSSPWSSS